MTRSTLCRLIAVLALVLFGINPGRTTIAAPDGESMDGVRRGVVLRLDPTTSTFRIPPPAGFTQRRLMEVQSATINVHYLPDGATDGFGFSCLTWPTEAVAAFEYAVSIWETLISTSVPIEVNACWTNFGDPNILGVSGADNYYRNFNGAPLEDTWYPSALANALHGSRIGSSTMDIHVAYGSTFPWYYGTDGLTPSNKVDLVSVVLHEICHGLGFAGSMTVIGNLGYWDWGDSPGYPVAYDRFTENGARTPLLSYPNGSAALAEQLTGGDLFFNGPGANAGNGGAPPALYVPATWKDGSSYSHLAESFNGSDDDLMTYSIPYGHSVHAPGPVIMGVLKDIGWPFENTAPVLSGLPDLTLASGEASDNAIDLWAYTIDDWDAASVMTYTIADSPPLTVGVTIDINRYIDITPTASFTGTFPVVVEVADTGGLTGTGTFTITFAEPGTRYIYLPLVLDCYPVLPTLLAISNPDGDGMYTVQWAMPSCSTQTPSQYELQVATNAQFTDASSNIVSATSFNAYTPTPATHYWRVRAYLNGQWTAWSNVQTVAVGAFSYVYVYNNTGGSMMIEIVNVQKSTFSNGFAGYWRSVPVGTYFVRVWMRCRYWQNPAMYFPLGESHALSFSCSLAASPASSTEVFITGIPGMTIP